MEELVKEIGKETGFRVEFCAADEEEIQDCMNVYTNENGKLTSCFTRGLQRRSVISLWQKACIWHLQVFMR